MRIAERTTLAQSRAYEPCSVFTLYSYEISDNWRWIEPLLKRIEKPDWTCESVRAELEQARAQLWGAQESGRVLGIWITRLEGDHGVLWIAAGSPLAVGLRLFNEHTVPWLKSKGCKYVQVIGRKGWKKVLADYKDVGVVLTKQL